MTIPMGFIRRVLSAGVLVAGLSGGLAHEVRAGDMGPSEDALRQFSDQIHLRAGAIAWRRMLEAQDVSGQCGCGKSSSGPDDINDAWKRAVITAFNIEQFVADFQAAARVALTHADVERFVQAGQTELGRKVLAAQNPELRNRDLETEMRELAIAGQELSVRPARRLALNTLIDLMGGVDSAVDSLSAVSLGIAIGVNAAGPQGGPRLTMDEIEDMTRMQ